MLLPNWREVLTRAWSVRLQALSIIFGAAELALPFLQGVLPMQPGTFALLIFLTNVAAVVARLLLQRPMSDPEQDEHDGVGA